MSKSARQDGYYVIHGMACSYFTKKLECYFLSKGIPYQFVEMDGIDMAQCGEKVGVLQMPHVQCPDGSWLTDTTPIIEYFESDDSAPVLHSKAPFTAFCSYFLEDAFDEWLWAPALYYRWAFEVDKNRRLEEFSITIMADQKNIPDFIKQRFVVWRQKNVHCRDNGITSPAHARYIEDLYIEVIDLLQPVFKARPYLFGERPCNADFGLFGPMFPHFGLDPTSQEIMLVRAPHLFRWLGRLWSTRPDELEDAADLTAVPEDLKPIVQKMADEYLPYLVENQKAFQAGNETTTYKLGGLDWEVLTAPYRVYTLSQLQLRFQSLDENNQEMVSGFLGDAAINILSQPVNCPQEMLNISASKPFKGDPNMPTGGRLWETRRSFVERFQIKRALKQQTTSVPQIKEVGASWLPPYFRLNRAK